MSTLRGIRAEASPPDGANAPVFASIDLYRAYWDASVDGLFAIQVTPEGEFLCGGLNPALELATGLSSKNTVGKPPEAFLDRNRKRLRPSSTSIAPASGRALPSVERWRCRFRRA